MNLKYDKKKISQINYLVTKEATDSSYDKKGNTYYYTIQNHVFSLRSTLSLALELQKADIAVKKKIKMKRCNFYLKMRLSLFALCGDRNEMFLLNHIDTVVFSRNSM